MNRREFELLKRIVYTLNRKKKKLMTIEEEEKLNDYTKELLEKLKEHLLDDSKSSKYRNYLVKEAAGGFG